MTTRCGYIAILGAPNAGKSTLTNRLVGGKISIVTPKVQTTRVRMNGIAMEGDTQLIFIDTPGIFAAKRPFEEAMVEEAWAGTADADVIALLVDARKGFTDEVVEIIAGLQKVQKTPQCIILNKIDLITKPELIDLAQKAAVYEQFKDIFMISALKDDGVEDVKKYLAKLMPEGPWLYPEDQLTDSSMREIAAEITREKLFLRLKQELPYSVTVETETWETRENGTAVISQVIRVEREGQKMIVLGKNGEMLKDVGMAARRDIERQLGNKVHLTLFVKVDADWQKKGVRPESA